MKRERERRDTEELMYQRINVSEPEILKRERRTRDEYREGELTGEKYGNATRDANEEQSISSSIHISCNLLSQAYHRFWSPGPLGL